MDPETLSAAIQAAALAGTAAGVTEASKQAVVKGLGALVRVFKRDYGEQSKVVKAVEAVETWPDSEAFGLVLKKEIEAVQAHQNPEVQQVAQSLREEIDASPNTAQVFQQVFGSYNAVSGTGNATVNVNTPPKE